MSLRSVCVLHFSTIHLASSAPLSESLISASLKNGVAGAGACGLSSVAAGQAMLRGV